MNSIEERINATKQVEPDQADLEAIERIENVKDTSEGITLAEMDNLRAEQEYNGKISLRVPKTLHRSLVNSAKNEGVSLNQYILYKLAQ